MTLGSKGARFGMVKEVNVILASNVFFSKFNGHHYGEEGYGAGGFPAWGIPPKATLLFEIEVLEIHGK